MSSSRAVATLGNGLREPLFVRAMQSGGMKAAEVGLGFVVVLLLARWLGAAEYGRYAVAWSVLSLVPVFGALGLPQLLMRDGAVYEQDGMWGLRRGLLLSGLVYLALWGLLAAGVGIALIWGVLDLGMEDRWLYLLAVILAVPAMLLRVLGGWLLGRRRVVAGQLGEAVLRRGLVILFIGFAILTALRADATNALMLQGAALVLAAMAVAVLVIRDERSLPGAPPLLHLRRWGAGGASFLAIGALTVAMQHTDVLMLGSLVATEDAGIYHLAARMAELAALALAAVNVVLAPLFARLAAAGEIARLHRIAVTSARLLTLLGLAALAGFAVFGGWLLGLFGVGFSDGRTALLILAAAQVANLACGSVALLLSMAGHAGATARGMAAGAGANVALNALLIPLYGIEGAALATGASLILWNLILLAAVGRKLNIDPSILGLGLRRRAA